MLEIDGSQGEGGGQVLRTCLSIAAVTGRPFQIRQIRANRSRPGLRPQHLTAVQATAKICRAELDGDELDSTGLVFRPNSPPSGGEYAFDVTEASPSGHSAGAVTLIVQAILWPLLFAGEPSRITLSGGTFVPFSPPFHYLAEVLGPALSRFGISMSMELKRWGWMAGGDGEMILSVRPKKPLNAVRFEPYSPGRIGGVAAVTNLPSHIPHRMARRAHNLLAEAGLQPAIKEVRERSAGPGAGIVLWMTQAGFSYLGRKGLPADKVAQAAVAELLAFVDNGAAVDYHLADQLLLPMALADGRSSFTTNRLTGHTLTNIRLLRQLLGLQVTVEGERDQPGSVAVSGISFDIGQ